MREVPALLLLVVAQRKPPAKLLRLPTRSGQDNRRSRAEGLRCAEGGRPAGARQAFSASFHFTAEPVLSSDRS